MASKVYNIWIVAILVYLLTISNSFIPQANAAGKVGGCGNAPAASLIPCLAAAKNGRIKVPPACCGKFGDLLKTSPKCLCAALLSPAAKNAGVNPAIAVTIPKRCNIKNRPVGKRCGRYVVPWV